MNQEQLIEKLKIMNEPSISDQLWDRIYYSIQQKETDVLSKKQWINNIREYFNIRYFIPIVTPSLVMLIIFFFVYFVRATEYKKTMMFSQSTEYIYSICKY